MARLISLLEKGYFARELPPPFNTDSFSAYASQYGTTWNKAGWKVCGSHNLARPGGLRRPLKIPNPISYFAVAEVIVRNWIQIRNHTWQRRFSASRPHIVKSAARAIIPRYGFRELPRLRAFYRRNARYVLQTDISQFYPALYTHAVPWALHTKTVCKAALLTPRKGNNLLGNQIDRCLRLMNDGQTHGIPIGPDTSLVIAEILLASVDEELAKKCPGLLQGFRYVDDYELSFANLRDAEQVLAELQGVLSRYELILNPRKTRIEELPGRLQETWGTELGKFSMRDISSPVGQRNDIVELFSRAFELASTHREEAVLRYAVARVQKENVHSDGWRAFENCVLGSMTVDPSTFSIGLGTLHNVAQLGNHQLSKSALRETIEGTIERHAKRGEGSEVAWALWAALAWSISLSGTAAAAVGVVDDDIVALLALDADSRGLLPAGALDKSLWINTASQSKALDGEHWLLAYEGNQQGWLQSPAVATDPVFAALAKAGVSFYDPTRNAPQFPNAAGRIPGGDLSHDYA